MPLKQEHHVRVGLPPLAPDLHVVEVEERPAYRVLEAGDHVRRVLHGHLTKKKKNGKTREWGAGKLCDDLILKIFHILRSQRVRRQDLQCLEGESGAGAGMGEREGLPSFSSRCDGNSSFRWRWYSVFLAKGVWFRPLRFDIAREE